MTYTIAFAGQTLLTTAQGVYQFKRGPYEYKTLIEGLPHANKEVVKPIGRLGATHELTLVYMNVAESGLNAIYNLFNGLNVGTTGTLTGIPDHSSLANCVIRDTPDIAEPIKVLLASGSEGYLVEVKVVFRQVK